MIEVKQVTVMRTDLGMRKGKMIAQAEHASMAFLFDRMHQNTWDDEMGNFSGSDDFAIKVYTIQLNEEEQVWKEGHFTKVCVRVESEEELLTIHEAALKAGLTSHLITDAGLTEFHGVPTKTCCAIGPNWSEAIDQVTGHLKLL